MKLIVKRIGPDMRGVDIRSVGDRSPARHRMDDLRPLALFTEAGEALPCQARLVIESEPHMPPKIIVTFYLDDEHISLE